MVEWFYFILTFFACNLWRGHLEGWRVWAIVWFQIILYTQVTFSTSSFLFCFTPISDLESSFFLGISYICSIFYKNLRTFFRAFLAAKFFSSLQKVGPHAHQQPFHRFPSHQQLVDLNDWWNLQSMPNKVSIFESSSNDWATVWLVYVVI